MTYEQWVIVAVGACVGAGCALIGTFLVLRKIAMLGDAISHAVLPGIAIAFLLSGSRATLPMVIGAGVFGVITVLLVSALARTRRINEDASIGVVFPALFSVGVILISKYAAGVDLEGALALAPLLGEPGAVDDDERADREHGRHHQADQAQGQVCVAHQAVHVITSSRARGRPGARP